MVVLTLKAKHDHLQKVASTHDHVKAISEFVWNALDADAKSTSVEFERNALGGLESIIIRDDGTGISKERAEHDFESLGESWKRTKARTPVLARAIHGKEGQGRLRFFSLARRAHWDTVYEGNNALFKLTIDIDADRLEISNVSDPTPADASAKPGTIVQLAPLKETFDWLTGDEARSEFDSIFAPYILQYPDAEIIYDGKSVDPKRTIERSHEFPKQAILSRSCRKGPYFASDRMETARHSKKDIFRRRKRSRPWFAASERHCSGFRVLGICIYSIFQRDR
jgi:hypothetical protein